MKQISNIVFREKSPVETMIIEESIALDGSKCFFVQNDLYMLFNQERLEALGNDTMLAYLSSLQPTNDGLSELRSKCTDEQLLGLIKSRHIQSRNELLIWSNFLNNSADELTKAITEAENMKSNSETIKFEKNETIE